VSAQVKAFKPSLVSVGDVSKAEELRALLSGVFPLPESAPHRSRSLRRPLTRA
jgi:hypothetical protein